MEHSTPRLPSPSPNPRVYSNSSPLSQWCHPTVSFSVVPFSSCLQSFPASGSLQMSKFFASGGQSIGVSASTSVLPMNTQDWSPLGWTGWISLQSKGLSGVFSNTTVQKHPYRHWWFIHQTHVNTEVKLCPGAPLGVISRAGSRPTSWDCGVRGQAAGAKQPTVPLFQGCWAGCSCCILNQVYSPGATGSQIPLLSLLARRPCLSRRDCAFYKFTQRAAGCSHLQWAFFCDSTQMLQTSLSTWFLPTQIQRCHVSRPRPAGLGGVRESPRPSLCSSPAFQVLQGSSWPHASLDLTQEPKVSQAWPGSSPQQDGGFCSLHH